MIEQRFRARTRADVVARLEAADIPTGAVNDVPAVVAHPQLVEVLATMSADVVSEATVVIDIPRRGVEAGRLAADPAVGPVLRNVVRALLARATTAGSIDR